MKLSIFLPLAATLVAEVADAAVVPSCNGALYQSTATVMHHIVASTTTTATIRPTVTSTSTSTLIAFATRTNFKLVTTTSTSTTYITRLFPITTISTVTSTDSFNAVTITPDSVTSTVSSLVNFTPAASALAVTNLGVAAATTALAGLAGLSKRANIGVAIGPLCSINFYKPTRTVTITASTTKGAAVTQTAIRSTYSTSTRMIALGGVKVINTVQTATTIVPTTRTSTTTVTFVPTFTAAPVVVNFYQACIDANLLNLTNIVSDDTDGSSVTTAAGSLPTNTDPLIAAALPRPVRLDAATANQVGINSIFPGSNMMIVASSSADAASCCIQCQQYTNCAGSYFSAYYGTCNLVINDQCADQSDSTGQFYYDDNMQLTPGSGLTISNGNCGQWTYGGANDS